MGTASASAGTAPHETPGLYRSTEPAWRDYNLRELAGHNSSPLLHPYSSGARVQLGVVGPGREEMHEFRPKAPPVSVPVVT